jgi:hypothetical protein
MNTKRLNGKRPYGPIMLVLSKVRRAKARPDAAATMVVAVQDVASFDAPRNFALKLSG